MTAVWLIGGSGLVGGFVEARLAHNRGFVSFARRSAAAPFQRQIDFEALPGALDGYGACEVAISCLGTTIRTAGSQVAMRRVDHDYNVAFAAAAKAHGARQFILVSSVGANAALGNFYLRLKGETEADVRALGFDRVDILRPGLLLGDRKETRPGERFAALLAPLLGIGMVGGLSKYRGIRAETVASAIANLAGALEAGASIHENREIEALASA